MTKRVVISCDKCGSIEGCKQFQVYMDRFTDAAGSRDDVTHDFDLCGYCALKVIDAMFSPTNGEYNVRLLKEMGLEGVIAQ